MEEHPVQVPTINLTSTDPSIPGWHRETTFLRSYPSGSDPIILVIGVYNGVIAQLLVEQIPDARFYLFEPQDWAAAQLREKFGHLSNVKVCEFALGDRNGTFQMAFYGQDTCSFVRGPTPLTPGHEAFFDGRMREFTEVMGEEGIENAYYAFINVESYEHVLLPHLERSGWLERLDAIGMSWHQQSGPVTWLGEPTTPPEELRDILAKRHDLVLDIDNWQSWVRRDMPVGASKPIEKLSDPDSPPKCGYPGCDWTVPEGKDPVASVRAHKRKHVPKGAERTLRSTRDDSGVR